MQLLLQMLHRRINAARAHTQAQRLETPEDAHLQPVWQVVHTGDLPAETFAKTRRKGGEATATAGQLNK